MSPGIAFLCLAAGAVLGHIADRGYTALAVVVAIAGVHVAWWLS